MAVSRFAISRNILLDQTEFEVAAVGLQGLSEDLNRLENRIRELLEELRVGFDTPAGARFFDACTGRLLEPMRDQAIVLNHIAQNLRNARSRYQSVFDEYKALNSSIGNV